MKIKRLYCSVEGCKKSFRSEEQLIAHTKVHSTQDELSEDSYSFQCEICFAKFTTKRSVSAHRRVHKINDQRIDACNANISLTKNFVEPNQDKLDIPDGPFSIEDIQLPPITSPYQATLPPFSSIFYIKS